jgi:polyether ionophore transport system ATP-binding protein
VIRYLAERGIHSLVSQPPTLEELFLRHYGDELAQLEGDGQREVDTDAQEARAR